MICIFGLMYICGNVEGVFLYYVTLFGIVCYLSSNEHKAMSAIAKIVHYDLRRDFIGVCIMTAATSVGLHRVSLYRLFLVWLSEIK